VVSCLIGVGLGSALIIVPSVPLMLMALEQRTGKTQVTQPLPDHISAPMQSPTPPQTP
jgi:hypothetical protein